MATPEELAGWYAAAWNERDPRARRELLGDPGPPSDRAR